MDTAREPHLVRFRVHAEHAEDAVPGIDDAPAPSASDDGTSLEALRPAPPSEHPTPFDRLDRWRDDPRVRIAGIALLAVVAGLYWYRSALDGEPAPLDEVVVDDSGSGSDGATAGTGRVVVHVSGAVARPGLLRLDPGARVADAVEAAGGAVADADMDQLNLAAPLGDGERIHVPIEGEVLPVAAGAGTTGAGTTGPVNVNSASAAELETLPGVGPTTAQAIVTARAEHRFESVDDLLRVRGIGPSKLEELRPLVTA